MGRRDKHGSGRSRNNAVFGVAGGKAVKAKDRPKGLDLKLKKITKKTKEDAKLAVQSLDQQMTRLQQQKPNVFQPKAVVKAKVTPIQVDIAHVDPAEVEDIAQVLGGISTSTSVSKEAPKK